MRKFLKLLTLFSVVFVGSIFLIGIIGPGAVNYDGPIVGTAGLNKDETKFTLLSEDKTGLTFRLDVGKIEFVSVMTKEGGFVLPRVGKFTRSFKIGEPCLPVGSKLFSIPFGCKLKAEVINSTTKEIKVPGLILPVQPPISKSTNPAAVPFEYNRALYAAGKYELPLVSTKIPGIMRATRFGQVFVSPMVYYPNENRATVYKSVTIRVTFQNPNWTLTNKMQKRYASFFFEPVHRGLLNYKSSEFLKHDLVKYPVRYVIVSDRMFESQLQPFIAWKTKKGFAVTVGYTDVIGTTNTAIKSYIQNLYNTLSPAPSFVLFVGDAQQIPPFTGSAGSHVTDLKFCEYTGDNIPEIYYGRFSAQTTAQLQPQIDKTMEYEQLTMPDPSYLGEVTLVSGVDSGYAGTYGNGQINYGTNLYFNTAHGISPNVWLYPASDGSSAPSDIKATINAGIGFYNYTAHGSHTGPSDPALTTTDVPNLTNTHKYLLGIANACLTNTFGTNYSTPCFGEVWLQTANKGGIGWIGGSNSTYWDEDYWFGVGNGPIVAAGPTYAQTGQGAYDGIFHDHGEPVYHHYTTNSAVIFAGNTAVVEAGSSLIQYYWEIYHLMGDPSVMTYMGVPSANSVYHASSVTTTATSFNVQAAPGSYVGITKSGVLHGAAYVGTSGAVDVPITAFGSSGTATIFVTCQNKEPYEANIPINAGTEPPVANFVGTPLTGTVPLTVNFTDTSSNGPTTWAWTFGDGGTSGLQNPSHQYTTTGYFTVTLTVTNAYGSDSETKTNYINVTTLQPPVANFTANDTTITVGQNVTFTDTSTNNPTSWSWTFENGAPATSTAQNPVVTYNTAGTFNVTLIATNAAGSDTEAKVDYISVSSVSYCASQGSSQVDEWLKIVVVGPINNTSGASPYSDFTGIVGNLTAGTSASVSLTAGYSGSAYKEYFRIFIDYNQDGDFVDSGETVFSKNARTKVTGSFTVPTSALKGNTRMRVSMKYGAYATSCETFSYGEVEDYTVNIL
jgi:PKD repeat protein